MKNFILSLPCGTTVSDFETIQVKHPKGREVTCFVKDHEIFELLHFEFKRGAASCFVTVDSESKVESLGMVKAVKYDLIFLLVPVLEALESKGKISLDDLEIPQKLRQCALNSKNEDKLCRVFDTKKRDDILYLRYDRNKFMEYLKSKCDELVLKVKDLKLLDGSGDDRIKSYAAHLIKDCLSKDNTKYLDEILGLRQDEQKENQPPAKKAKFDKNETPSEDYSNGDYDSKPKEEIKLTKAQKDLKKAAKGSKSIASFFTPKKK